MVIPMCWKCREAVLSLKNEVDFPIVNLTACTACDKIKSYDDAMIHCPLLKEESNVQS